jgi:hypothetical protein
VNGYLTWPIMWLASLSISCILVHHTNFNFLNFLQHARIEMIPFAVINSECAKDRCFKKGQYVTDIGVAHLFRSCRNLKYFELYAFSEITDNFLFELSVHCPFLKHLSLAHSEFITAKGIISILACCRRLRKLKLTGNYP